ncbi:uncharacterized protein [Asterias amurensis]|uniref:uncharacterized protein n=1 Tax=Asterias amurensis TaxID=7602 RepID=UPI003AB6E6CD
MGSYVITTVFLFSLLGCGLSFRARGAHGKRPLDFPGSKRDFAYPGKLGFEHRRKPVFERPVTPRMEPTPTEVVEVDVEVEYPDLVREDDVTTTLRENPVVCEVCKFVVADLQKLLGNDSSKIVAFLDSLCADLPAEYAATCKEYVDGWTPYIIDFLENSTPDEICAEITLCTAGQTEVDSRLGMHPFDRFVKLFRRVIKTRGVDQIMMRYSLGNDYLCQACDEIVEVLYTQLITDHVLDEVTALLKEVCGMTPVAAECTQLVEQYSAEVKALAKQYLNNQTCVAIGLCPGFEVDPLDSLSGIFDDILPDMDLFKHGRFRPRPRPRPDSEPAPRDHPHREHDRNSTHREHDRNSTHGAFHHNHQWYNYGRHHGHGPVSRPRPSVTRWWLPGSMRPVWPRPSHWGGHHSRPSRPLDPMSPTQKPTKPSEPMPEPETPRPTLPFVPNPKVIHPKKPYPPKKPSTARTHPHQMADFCRYAPPTNIARLLCTSPMVRRSVVINTVNTGDLDNGFPYDVEGDLEPEVKNNWQCDSCTYGVDLLQSYLLERAGSFEEKLMRVANSICHKLPPTTVAECKTEVAGMLNGLVLKVIDSYVKPDEVCPLLNLC